MAVQAEKIYVALGNDLQDGIKTLEWTLRKWNSHQFSIVILHLPFNTPMDFVYTPFGKLPASFVNDEKLEALDKYEKEKMNKLLSEYISFCGKVKVELLKVDKWDEPIHKIIVDLISANKITKLVMGFTFFKSSSWKIKNSISGSFYIHKHKPDFCELFIIYGGKLVFLRGENKKGIMENGEGVMIAKLREKNGFKGWLEKMFIENPSNSLERDTHRSHSSPTALDSPSSQNQCEIHMKEIENYYQHLLSLNLDDEEEEDCGQKENEDSQTNPMEAEHGEADLNAAENIESLKAKIREVKKKIQLKKNEAKANIDRYTKAERAIFLSNRRVEDLQARIKEEVSNRTELQKELEAEKEHIHEVMGDIEESKNRLNSIKELQSELSNKLHISTLGKSHAEAQVEKAVNKRAEMVREIEELRQQRDVLHRRIEFCREKDAIGMVARLGEPSCGFKVYTAEEIRLATNGFSERLRLKPGGDWTTVYRGRIENATVAIKILNSVSGLSQEDFQAKHPHLVAVVGFCIELKCVVYEYMHNGSLRDIFLRDILHTSHTNSKNKIRTLQWHERVRVAAQVCSGLVYLHLMKPRPIVHGHLTLSNILLDRNLVAKISSFGLTQRCDEHSVQSDIRAFGVLIMHLLTGRNWTGLVEAMTMDRAAVIRDLDGMAGQWPLYLAERLAGLALRCLSSNRGPNSDLNMATVMEELNELKNKADQEVVAWEGSKAEIDRDGDSSIAREDSSKDVPSFLLCPIFQDVMKNPHVAADGFSYELEAMEQWLRMGHKTSPMTNLRLKHTYLTPNHALRSLIQDWHNKKSVSTTS
ncbi:hypothetical protein FEM48_Zijuj08G0144400 [Ziziphus jujuba var. spinosa]|uniref:RING-type E3 ubiquitin transferase n=1 Tax=Ziziphus jujuba var. spinosa TaxID=714518 RepID=A0A978UZM6_ZIZJJ|nr:hypothetical protein FEM48_Zijuj08G0144400 [Ziziphus jujuba var. spinosa]